MKKWLRKPQPLGERGIVPGWVITLDAALVVAIGASPQTVSVEIFSAVRWTRCGHLTATNAAPRSSPRSSSKASWFSSSSCSSSDPRRTCAR